MGTALCVYRGGGSSCFDGPDKVAVPWRCCCSTSLSYMQVTPTLALYDTMQYVRSPTATVCYGMCLGMGGFLLTAGGEKVSKRGAGAFHNHHPCSILVAFVIGSWTTSMHCWCIVVVATTSRISLRSSSTLTVYHVPLCAYAMCVCVVTAITTTTLLLYVCTRRATATPCPTVS